MIRYTNASAGDFSVNVLATSRIGSGLHDRPAMTQTAVIGSAIGEPSLGFEILTSETGFTQFPGLGPLGTPYNIGGAFDITGFADGFATTSATLFTSNDFTYTGAVQDFMGDTTFGSGPIFAREMSSLNLFEGQPFAIETRFLFVPDDIGDRAQYSLAATVVPHLHPSCC